MSDDRFHLAVAPPRGASPGLVREIGDIVGLSAYDARLRIIAALPRSLACFPRRSDAIRAGESLGAMGVATTVFAESRLPPVAPLIARRWQWSGEDLVVSDRNDNAVEQKAGELGFVAFGFRAVVRAASHLEEDVHIGPRGSVMRSYRVATQRRKDLPLFALLIPRDSLRGAVLFDASLLDFHCLSGRREASDNANMRRLHVQMEQAWPGLSVDKTLLEHRPEPENHRYFNRRTCDDATVAVCYVTWYLRLAAEAADNFFDASA